MYYPVHYGSCGPVSRANVTRWNDVFGKSDWLSSVFDDFFKDVSSEVRGYVPSWNVRDEEKAYYVDVEVPGVDKKDIHLSLKDGVLTVEGERHDKRMEPSSEGKADMASHYTFKRSVHVGDNVIGDQISAELDKGILTITLPKSEKQSARRIEIN